MSRVTVIANEECRFDLTPLVGRTSKFLSQCSEWLNQGANVIFSKIVMFLCTCCCITSSRVKMFDRRCRSLERGIWRALHETGLVAVKRRLATSRCVLSRCKTGMVTAKQKLVRFWCVLSRSETRIVTAMLVRFWCISSMLKTGMVTAKRTLLRFRCAPRMFIGLIACIANIYEVRNDSDTRDSGAGTISRTESTQNKNAGLYQRTQHIDGPDRDEDKTLKYTTAALQQDPQQTYDLLLQATGWRLLFLAGKFMTICYV